MFSLAQMISVESSVNGSANVLAAIIDVVEETRRKQRPFEPTSEHPSLPPDVPLPPRLRRYEEKGQGQYSLRQQVAMVLAVQGWDPRRVAARIKETAPPLPSPLWSASYDPYPGWEQVFQGAMAEMISASGDTTKFLEAAEEQWLRQANALRLATRAALELPSSNG